MTRKYMLLLAILFVLPFMLGGNGGCGMPPTNSDSKQAEMQEKLLSESVAQVGMPAITNFREKKMLKDILELRDQTGLVTYTYLWNEYNGKLVFFGETVGYGIPYATQFTNPQKIEAAGHEWGYAITAQADPSGLFSPSSAEGTWILMKDPRGTDVKPVYVESRIVVLPFRAPDNLVAK